MRWRQRLGLILRSLFLRNRVEAELDQEFAFHLERQTQENIRAGLAPADAERAARRSLDGIAQQKELCRETRGTRVIENFLRDLRYALRAFARSPGFSTIVILTLAVGIGANTAIFSLLDRKSTRLNS